MPGSGVATASVRTEGRKLPARGENLAISDDGAYMLAVSGGSVRLLGLHGENRTLVPGQPDAMVAFAASGHDVAVMDSVTGLTLIRDASGAAGQQVLVGSRRRNPPARSAWHSRAMARRSSSPAARRNRWQPFKLADATRTAIGCACTPNALIPMGNVFRLNQFGSAPLWILDTGSSTPRTVFVPMRAE